MTIVVAGEHEFQMHRGLLYFHSDYFKNLLDGPFKEGGSNRHALSDVSLDTFTMFYNWMYTGSVVNSAGASDADLDRISVIDTYIFADFHMVPQFKNRALELFYLVEVRSWTEDIFISSYIYAKTTESSSLRKLLMDESVETYNFEELRKHQKSLPREFIADLFDTYRKLGIAPGSMPGLKKGNNPYIQKKKQSFCANYHEHKYKPDTDINAS
jgi:hypothetical protein